MHNNNNNANFNSLSKEKEIAARKIQSFFRMFQSKKIKAAFKASWMTGSNGAVVLPMLSHTGYQIKPTGHLLRDAMAPLCGELTIGIALHGASHQYVSGVDCKEKAGFMVAWAYACKLIKPFATIEKNIAFSFERLLKKFEARMNDVSKVTASFTYQEINDLILFYLRLLQLREINENKYQLFTARCDKVFDAICKNDFFWNGAFENYLNPLPLHHLHTKGEEEETKKRLSDLRLLITRRTPHATLTQAEITQLITQAGFPIAFLAAPLDAAHLTMGLVAAEFRYDRALTLGKEIQMIVTDNQHQSHVRKFLNDHQLRDKIFVFTLDEFIATKYDLKTMTTKMTQTADAEQNFEEECTRDVRLGR